MKKVVGVLRGWREMCSFAAVKEIYRIMTAMELNAQIWRDIAEIADSEPLMKQLAKYLKKLTSKKHDPTLMTKEEFFARVDEAKKGPSKQFENIEELDKYIRSL